MDFDAAGGGELCAFVLAQGRVGLARVEIAAALGVRLERLEARAKADAALGEALDLADEAAQAWWAEQQREALAAGRGVNSAAWREAMAWRFGGEPAAEAPAAPAKPRVIFNLPAPRPPRTIVDITLDGTAAWYGQMSDGDKRDYWRKRLKDAEAEAGRAKAWLAELGDDGTDEGDGDDGDGDER